MKKRLIVAALTVCMILTMLPAAALAAQGVSYIERRWENNTVVSVEKTAESYTVVTSSVTVWTTGWYVVTGSVTIGGGVTVDGDVHLILADGCKLTVSKPSSSRKAGINVADGNSLTIYGQAGETGSLTVEGGYRGAGIGGIGGNYDVGQTCGTVIIHGGKINTKGNYSAGIGGGSGDNDYKGGAGGTVTIYGGTVEADGGESGAGIGGGMGLGSGDGGNGGTVTIYGGNVTAKGNSGIGGADCGGTGSSAIISTGGTGGKVTIFGGTVTAEGGLGAGIGGGGEEGAGGDVTISGRTVKATSRSGAGIGGGSRSSDLKGRIGGTGGKVTIFGGTVTAEGGAGAGIGGGGEKGAGGDVTISGGTVVASSRKGGAGIGGGAGTKSGGAGGTLKIYGGSILALSGQNYQQKTGARIGSGASESADGAEVPPINGEGQNLYLTTLTLMGVKGAARNTVVKSIVTEPHCDFGTEKMTTDDSGKLYLYLPEGTKVTSVLAMNNLWYTGSVETTSDGTAGCEFLHISRRTVALDLTGTSVSYKAEDGSEKSADPRQDITDTDEGWRWRPGEGTSEAPHILYLDGVDFYIDSYNGVLLPDNTKVLVSGRNTITMAESAAYILALRSQGNLEITGTNDGELIVTAGDTGNLESMAVFASGQLTVSGSVRLQAAGGRSKTASCGISAGNSILIKDSAQVSAYGNQAPNGVGIMNDEGAITIQDSATVTAYGGSGGATKNSAGISAENNISISGQATVTAIGGTATHASIGIVNSWNGSGVDTSLGNEIVISGGNVTAVGGAVTEAGFGSAGLAAGSITLSGGFITAVGGVGSHSYGLRFPSNGLAITGGRGVAMGKSSATNVPSFDVAVDNQWYDNGAILLWGSPLPEIPAAEVELSESEVSLLPEGTKKLTATAIYPARATQPQVSWTSSNPAIATVDQDGVVTGVSIGTTTITATTFTGAAATCTVTVKTHYTLTVENVGDGGTGGSYEFAKGLATIKAGSKPGYTFTGWTSGDIQITEPTLPTLTITLPAHDVMITANWTPVIYTIYFESNGGSDVSSVTGEYSATISKRADPSKTGHTFAGWFKDEALTNEWIFESDTIPENGITLYAKWTVKEYTVTFESNGGSDISPVTGEYGTTISKPADPSKTGHTFAGWFKDEALTNEWSFESDTIPENGITLYAKWTPNSTGGGPAHDPEPTPTPAPTPAPAFPSAPSPTPAPSDDTFVFTPSLIGEMTAGNQSINIDNGLQLLADLDSIPRGGEDAIIIRVSEIRDADALSAFYDAYPTQKALFKGYEVDFTVEGGGRSAPVTGLLGAITLKFRLTPEELRGIDPASLVVYKEDDDGNVMKLYGAFDWATRTYTVTTDHLCSFYLMAEEAPGAPWTSPFTDVKDGDWFCSAVAFVTRCGFYVGTSADTFSPEETMTRAMFWTVLGRLNGQTLTGAGAYDAARLWAMRAGITDGTNPGGAVTREQAVTLLWRFAGSPKAGGDISAFSDAGRVSDYARGAMAWAVENGILNGIDGALKPQGTATRAQAAAILMRFIEAGMR